MRRRYRIYVCPEDGCPAVGRGILSRCAKHGDREMVPVIVRREDAPATETAYEREARDGLSKLRERGPEGAKIADSMERIARDLGILR